jgi:hypothetical protein
LDGLELAAVVRAQAALQTISNLAPADNRAQARAFVHLALDVMRAHRKADLGETLRRSTNELVQKAAAHVIGDDIWIAPEASALAASFLQSIAPGSLLDMLAKYATTLPNTLSHALVASGSVAGTVSEAGVKVVKRLPFALAHAQVHKVAAIVVLSEELALGIQGSTLFENELTKSVQRASNAAVVNALMTTSMVQISSTGDALADLRAGLRASVPSSAYVVAASGGIVADLATRVENKGAGIRGGTFVDGVELVPVDELSGMNIIAADRISLADGGLRVSPSTEASVNMADSPTSPSQLVNLWQTNCRGILAERQFRIATATDADIVHVG